MKSLITLPAQQFVGHAYTTESSDQMGTFAAAWEDFETTLGFARLDALTKTPNRTAMIVFSPYSAFLYWVGSLLPDKTPVPKGYESFKLPNATAGQVLLPAEVILQKQIPVEMGFNKGLETLEKAGYTLPAHIGQTDHPYYLESYQVHKGAIQQVEYRLYIDPDQLGGYDEYD